MSPIKKLFQFLFNKERGQSLVEIAVLTPILIVIGVGLFEVGYALWGYITLLNVDREVARFAVRPEVLDFSTIDKEEVGYYNVYTHTLTANSNQLRLGEYFENTESGNPDGAKAFFIVSHIFVDTANPCPPDDPNCACDAADFVPYDLDDLVVNSQTEGYEFLQYSYPSAAASETLIESRLDMDALTQKLKDQNNELNCDLLKRKGSDFTDNSIVVVEGYYEQPQLIGFPMLSWILNPLPLYTQTTLRIDSNLEGRCEVIPIASHIDTINLMKAHGGEDDLLQGDHEPSGNYGWLSWNGESSAVYLDQELDNKRSSANDYIEPDSSPPDTKLNVGDFIDGLPGVVNSDAVRDDMEALKGKTVLIPVYDYVAGNGTSGKYHVHSFARVRIGGSDLPTGHGGYINAIVIEHPVDEACPGTE